MAHAQTSQDAASSSSAKACLLLSDSSYGSSPAAARALLSHYASTDGRRLVTARASGDQVCLLDGNFDILYTLDFWDAFTEGIEVAEREAKRIQCLTVRGGTEEGQVLIFAAIAARIVVWAASNVSSSSTKRWRVHSALNVPGPATSLDFDSGRLLVGYGSSLQIWSLHDDRLWRESWKVEAPRPIRLCSFSPLGTSFAACSEEDRRVIVWQIKKAPLSRPRRTAILPHASYVIDMTWRGMPDPSSQCDILITRSQDGAARVWAPVIDEPASLRLSATIDAASFGKRSPGNTDTIEPIFYLDAATIASVLRANINLLERDIQMSEVGLSSSDQPSASRDLDAKRTRHKRLQHMISDTPDVFIRFQEDGTIVMRALASIDRRPPTLLQAYTVLKLANPLHPIRPGEIGNIGLVPLSVSPGQSSEAALGVLHLRSRDDGRTLAADFNPSLFFDGQGMGLVKRNISLESSHGGKVRAMLSTRDRQVLSIDDAGCVTQWATVLSGRSSLGKRSLMTGQRRSELPKLHNDDRLLAGHEGSTVVWHSSTRSLLHYRNSSTKPEQLVGLAEQDEPIFGTFDEGGTTLRIVTVQRMVHEWHLTGFSGSHKRAATSSELDGSGALRLAFAPADQSVETSSSFATLSVDGQLTLWQREQASERWTRVGRSVQISLGDHVRCSATSGGLLAVSGSQSDQGQIKGRAWSRLQISDVAASDFDTVLLYSQLDNVEGEDSIVSLDWLKLATNSYVLAVCRQHRIEVWAEATRGPYDTAKDGGKSAWAILATYDLTQITRQAFTACRWAQHHTLVVATGHQVHSLGPLLTTAGSPDSTADLGHVAREQTGPLPVYHPVLLSQLLLLGKTEVAVKIVLGLAKALEETPVGETPNLRALNEIEVEHLRGGQRDRAEAPEGQEVHDSLFTDDSNGDDSARSTLSSDTIERLCSRLQTASLPRMALRESQQLSLLIRCLLDISERKHIVDANGWRYLTALRMQRELHKVTAEENKTGSVSAAGKTSASVTAMSLINGASSASVSGLPTFHLAGRDTVWALHSATQEAIVSGLKETFGDKLTWPVGRSTGMFYFLPPASASPLLLDLAEQVARDQYSLTRDPVSCSLLYYALGKKKLVLGLWRQAAGHPEQKKMLQFLTKDFEEERWRTAACKNAFALLSQRRFELAASFFMLGDSVQDAVNVCIKNLNDIDLAIALVRIKEGRDDGPLFVKLLKTRILPLAFDGHDRYLAHWAFWRLGQREMAVRVLCTSMDLLRSEVKSLPPSVSDASPRVARYEDVSLAVLYLQMKKRGILADQDARFAKHMEKVLKRLGCHVVAEALLAEWEYNPYVEPQAQQPNNDVAVDVDTVQAIPVQEPEVLKETKASSNADAQASDTANDALASLNSSNAATRSETTTTSNPPSDEKTNGSAKVRSEAAEDDAAEEKKKETRKKPGGGVANLISSAKNADQQGAQEFDFGSFGF